MGPPEYLQRSSVMSVAVTDDDEIVIGGTHGERLVVFWRWLEIPNEIGSSGEAAEYFAGLLGVPTETRAPSQKRRWWKRSEGRRLRE